MSGADHFVIVRCSTVERELEILYSWAVLRRIVKKKPKLRNRTKKRK